MLKAEFEKLKDLIVKVMTLHQTAVSNHGHKEVFGILKKNETYGFNEMNAAMLLDRLEYLSEPSAKAPAQTAKLGLMDFIIGMSITQDFSPLYAIAGFFNHACFEIPNPDSDKADVLSLLQKINKEHFENSKEILDSIKDGTIKSHEARAISKESYELINAVASLKHLVDQKIK